MPKCVLSVPPSVLSPNATPTIRSATYLSHLFRGFQAEFRMRDQVDNYNRALVGDDAPPSEVATLVKVFGVVIAVSTAVIVFSKWQKSQ